MSYYYFFSQVMIFCLCFTISKQKKRSPVVRAPLDSSVAPRVKVKIYLDDRHNFDSFTSDIYLYACVCVRFDAVPWHKTRIHLLEMADREHRFMTRQVHVMFEPLGQSEHKRALPLHLVTRPAPYSHPRLLTGQYSSPCAVNAIESQCDSKRPCATTLASSAAASARVRWRARSPKSVAIK